MQRFFKYFSIFLVFILILYFLGPSPPPAQLDPRLPSLSNDLGQLEKDIISSERNVVGLKEDNQARILWFDKQHKKPTEYALVYLHGFTASQAEGAPLHRDFARRYGCNLYLARLDKHGIDNPDIFLEISPESLLKSAKEALVIGQKLGKKVILMCTSTGATLGLYLAAHHPEVAGLILYSPLVGFQNPALDLLDKPWGLQISQLVMGSKYSGRKAPSPKSRQYWVNKFRLEGAVALKSLVAATMTEETFKKINQPVFLGYYYKDEAHQDQTISVEDAQEMFKLLGTPDSLKKEVAFPNAKHHVIASYITSKSIESVKRSTFEFAEEILSLKALEKNKN